jgi:FkbM family methyltransferase
MSCSGAVPKEYPIADQGVRLGASSRACYITRVLRNWWHVAGPKITMVWLLIRLGSAIGLRGPREWRLRPPQARCDLTVRLRGSSDLSIFSDIFIHQEYSTLSTLQDVSQILDLGANAGYSSAFFLSCFPHAHVLAVEPDERNLEICRINLKPYGDRAKVLHGAVWSSTTTLSLSKGMYGCGGECATQVFLPDVGSQGDVQAWDLDSLIKMTGAKFVDLLKIDIERSELEIFGNNAARWLSRIRNLCIELHGQDCEDQFFQALSELEYELEHSGELTICRNLRPKRLAGPIEKGQRSANQS